MTSFANSMSIGVSEKSSPLLSTILDRCIEFTSDSVMTRWTIENSVVSHPTTPLDFLRQYPIQIISGIIMLALLAIGTMLYISHNKTHNAKKISQLVNYDRLTGSWSFLKFQNEAAIAIESGRDHEHAIVYIDINRFKNFNATFGFAEGDQLLIDLSKLLGTFIRSGECYARISADQFVALVHWQHTNEFVERLSILDEEINALPLPKANQYQVMLLVGVNVLPAGELDTEHPLSELIDCARYARESIGNVVHSTAALYSASMKNRDIAEREMQTEAVVALSRGEFVAYYQPKIEIRSGRIDSFEALARWESSEKGLRMPNEFIPVFEKTGFITELDLQLFRLACQRIRTQIDKGSSPIPFIACNFSRVHLQNDRFPETLKAIVDEYNVPAGHLELELTENIVIENFKQVQTVCHRLKSLGFSISIDDFGKGYSSLGTLQELPVDVIKLDQSFLMNSENESKNKVILDGIVAIARELGVKIVVEGVETLKQARMLNVLDAHIIAQGFLYSPPVSLEDSEKQLEQGFIGAGITD